MPVIIPSLLEVYIEVAIALVGFSGIIAAFQSRNSSELDTTNIVRFQFLLTAGFAAVIFCALPSILFTAGLGETEIWRSSSCFVLVVGFSLGPYRLYQLRDTKAFGFTLLQNVTMWTFALANVYYAQAWLYEVLMTAFLVIIFLAFASLVIQLVGGKEDGI